jgi:hypothetical protein
MNKERRHESPAGYWQYGGLVFAIDMVVLRTTSRRPHEIAGGVCLKV